MSQVEVGPAHLAKLSMGALEVNPLGIIRLLQLPTQLHRLGDSITLRNIASSILAAYVYGFAKRNNQTVEA